MILPKGILSGKTVAIFRPESQSASLCEMIVALGGEPLVIPAVRIVEPESKELLKREVERRNSYDWIVFTSANGVEAFCNYSINGLGGLKPRIAAVGAVTAEAVKRFGGEVSVTPEDYTAEEIAPLLGDLRDKEILLPLARRARDVLKRMLEERGAKVTRVDAYDIEVNKTPVIQNAIKSLNKAPHFLTFTSSSSVEAVCELLAIADKTNWLEESQIVAIGPITTETLRAKGYANVWSAEEYSAKGIVTCIEKNLGNNYA